MENLNVKELLGTKAAEFVESGMVVGLGTGSTAFFFIKEIARKIKEDNFKISAISSSYSFSKRTRDKRTY